MTPAESPLVSLVIPALNEIDNVPRLVERVREWKSLHVNYAFELVLVDDGSTDGTAELVLDTARDIDLQVVRLSRRFGSHQAISAGFRHCSGDCAVVLGADLQEPVDLLGRFLAEWEAGFEVVWGVRRTRTRGWRSELPSRLFSALFTRYANLENYPPEGPSGVLITRQVIDDLNGLPERNRNVLALIAWLGYGQCRVEYDQLPRQHGETRWTRRHMIKLAVDSLIQFSSMPLRLCTFSGLGVAAAGLMYAVALVAMALLGVSTPSGWPTLLVVVLLLGGIQLTVVGVMGEYVWRAVEEVRGRPLYVVRRVHRRVGEGRVEVWADPGESHEDS
jgi:glycosyltransferase involved in cell wall biosynthesis